MTETSPSERGFIPGTSALPPPASAPAAIPAAPTTAPSVVVGKAEPLPSFGSTPGSDQLARIEDKCSRIEDKYARSEALLSRVEEKVEGAAGRMNEAARQSDLSALRSEVRAIADRTRGLPGSGALVLTAIITAVLTVALTIAAQRFHLDAAFLVGDAGAAVAGGNVMVHDGQRARGLADARGFDRLRLPRLADTRLLGELMRRLGTQIVELMTPQSSNAPVRCDVETFHDLGGTFVPHPGHAFQQVDHLDV